MKLAQLLLRTVTFVQVQASELVVLEHLVLGPSNLSINLWPRRGIRTSGRSLQAPPLTRQGDSKLHDYVEP